MDNMKKLLRIILILILVIILLIVAILIFAKNNSNEINNSVDESTDVETKKYLSSLSQEALEQRDVSNEDKILIQNCLQKYYNSLNLNSTLYYGMLYGEYTCAELKENIEKLEYTTSEIKYAIVDLNGDGEKELALQFASTEDSGENWVGIIRCKEGKLELTYSYEYGYRTEATLYENGLLAIGGSWGAGAYGMDYYRFDENCGADHLFSSNSYIGSFATQIAYDLQTDPSEVLDPTGDSDLLVESRLEVSEYIPAEKNGEGVKLSASGYSEDAGVKAAEEKMMQDLAAQGAELISGDEMDQLCSIETGTEVTWEIP